MNERRPSFGVGRRCCCECHAPSFLCLFLCSFASWGVRSSSLSGRSLNLCRFSDSFSRRFSSLFRHTTALFCVPGVAPNCQRGESFFFLLCLSRNWASFHTVGDRKRHKKDALSWRFLFKFLRYVHFWNFIHNDFVVKSFNALIPFGDENELESQVDWVRFLDNKLLISLCLLHSLLCQTCSEHVSSSMI